MSISSKVNEIAENLDCILFVYLVKEFEAPCFIFYHKSQLCSISIKITPHGTNQLTKLRYCWPKVDKDPSNGKILLGLTYIAAGIFYFHRIRRNRDFTSKFQS